jgi:hypothetical protein
MLLSKSIHSPQAWGGSMAGAFIRGEDVVMTEGEGTGVERNRCLLALV